MIHTLSAKIASDQNGYAGISSNAPIATSAATKMPKKRPKAPPRNSETAALSSRMPRIRVIQPHDLRSAKMYFVF
jgi:hypothetical protein